MTTEKPCLIYREVEIFVKRVRDFDHGNTFVKETYTCIMTRGGRQDKRLECPTIPEICQQIDKIKDDINPDNW